jgi:hypothetical protein
VCYFLVSNVPRIPRVLKKEITMIIIQINVVRPSETHAQKMRVWEALKGASYNARLKLTATTGEFFGHIGESLPYLHVYFTEDELSNFADVFADAEPLTVYNDCMNRLSLLGMNVLATGALGFLSGK